MAELLVFNPTTSASASLMSMEISITTHSINFKPILPNRQLYTMEMTGKTSTTTSAMTMMKETAVTTITLINRQKRNKRLGVAGTVVLIVIWKKQFH